ncbi:hypothetical protein M758_9G147700, partial [Ceratodon purpureus]
IKRNSSLTKPGKLLNITATVPHQTAKLAYFTIRHAHTRHNSCTHISITEKQHSANTGSRQPSNYNPPPSNAGSDKGNKVNSLAAKRKEKKRNLDAPTQGHETQANEH